MSAGRPKPAAAAWARQPLALIAFAGMPAGMPAGLPGLPPNLRPRIHRAVGRDGGWEAPEQRRLQAVPARGSGFSWWADGQDLNSEDRDFRLLNVPPLQRLVDILGLLHIDSYGRDLHGRNGRTFVTMSSNGDVSICILHIPRRLLGEKRAVSDQLHFSLGEIKDGLPTIAKVVMLSKNLGSEPISLIGERDRWSRDQRLLAFIGWGHVVRLSREANETEAKNRAIRLLNLPELYRPTAGVGDSISDQALHEFARIFETMRVSDEHFLLSVLDEAPGFERYKGQIRAEVKAAEPGSGRSLVRWAYDRGKVSDGPLRGISILGSLIVASIYEGTRFEERLRELVRTERLLSERQVEMIEDVIRSTK